MYLWETQVSAPINSLGPTNDPLVADFSLKEENDGGSARDQEIPDLQHLLETLISFSEFSTKKPSRKHFLYVHM